MQKQVALLPKKTVLLAKGLSLLLLALFFSVSNATESADRTKNTENIPSTVSSRAQSPKSDKPAANKQKENKKTHPAPVEQAVRPDRSPELAEQEAETFSRPRRTIPVVPMQTGRNRGKTCPYDNLNKRRTTPEYLQSKPRERDPFYDTVERTGGNPMNTQDRSTNRRVPR